MTQLEPTTTTERRRATYIDESGERQPSHLRTLSSGSVSVYGDHLIASFRADDGETDVHLEVRGGRLFLYSFDRDDGTEVAFTAEESRALLRAASHMLVANTLAAAKVLEAEPEWHGEDDHQAAPS